MTFPSHSARKRQADSGVSHLNNCPNLSPSGPVSPRHAVFLCHSVCSYLYLCTSSHPFFRSQVLSPFIQLLPILLDLAWHTTSSGELSRSFQTLSLGSLHSGTVHCPLGDTCPPHSAQGMLFNGRILSHLPIHKHTSILQSGPHSSCSLNAVRLNSGPERAGRSSSISSPIFQMEAVRLSPRPGPGQWKQPGTGWNQETTSAPTLLCDFRKSPPLSGLQFPDCKPGINIPLAASGASFEGQLRQ